MKKIKLKLIENQNFEAVNKLKSLKIELIKLRNTSSTSEVSGKESKLQQVPEYPVANYSEDTPTSKKAPYLNDLGCWIANGSVPSLEGTTLVLNDNYKQRTDAIQKCAFVTSHAGYDIMCLQNGGQCFSGKNARSTYFKNGVSTMCDAGGKGGVWSNHCYEINTIWIPKFTPVGCYKDLPERSLAILEKTSFQLDGDYSDRKDVVRKCARLAASRNTLDNPINYFAIQNGGKCMAGTNFDNYGISVDCDSNGKGGHWANAVYKFSSYSKFNIRSLGCYKDDYLRAIPSAENNNIELSGSYKEREDAVGKCARHAKLFDFKVFAIQDGGLCLTSAQAQYTFNIHGYSTACGADGKGGKWANEVYATV